MTISEKAKPELVAHRGYAKNYPENSLSAFSAAIGCNGKFLELDVQLTADHIPCVIHDETLLRTGGKDISVLDSRWSEIEEIYVGEDEKFGRKYSKERLTTLKDFAIFLQKNNDVHAFVELKEESIERFGNEIVLGAVLSELLIVQSQCTIISFDAPILHEVRKISDFPVGFVVHRYDEAHLRETQKLSPDAVICNYKKIPDEDGALWAGDWEWMLYEVTDPDVACKWSSRGVKYIETMDFSKMMTAINAA